MAWYHQATSHYISQCWTRSMSPYGVTRTELLKYTPMVCWSIIFHVYNICHIQSLRQSDSIISLTLPDCVIINMFIIIICKHRWYIKLHGLLVTFYFYCWYNIKKWLCGLLVWLMGQLWFKVSLKVNHPCHVLCRTLTRFHPYPVR